MALTSNDYDLINRNGLDKLITLIKAKFGTYTPTESFKGLAFGNSPSSPMHTYTPTAAKTLVADDGLDFTSLGENSLKVGMEDLSALATGALAVGTYAKVTVDKYGRVTAGGVLAAEDIPDLDWGKIASGKPTTLQGYGITDGVNAVSVSGSGNAVTTASIRGHTLTLTKGTSFLDLTSAQTVSGKKTFSVQQAFTVANGTAPFTVASGTKVANLNADKLDGHDDTYFATAAGLTSANGAITTLQGYFTDGVAKSALRLSDTSAQTIWGRTYWQNGVPKSVTDGPILDNAVSLYAKDKPASGSPSDVSLLTLSSNNVLLLGYGLAAKGYKMQLHGQQITLYVGDANATATLQATASGVNIPNSKTLTVTGLSTLSGGAAIPSGQALQIGNAVLEWESATNSLKVYNATSGAVANLYATGGVSAYGSGEASGGGTGGGTIDQQAVEDIVNSIITPAMRANWNAAYAVVDGAADADNVINKWHEVVSLLSGLGEAANLADLLDTFAPKNTIVSAGQGISLYTVGQTVGSVTLADDFGIRVNAGGGLTFDATTGALKVNAGSGLSINASTGVLSLSLPTASASTLGGVKVGKGLAISSGVLSLPLTDSATVGYMVYTGSTWVKRAAVPVADIQEMWDAA